MSCVWYCVSCKQCLFVAHRNAHGACIDACAVSRSRYQYATVGVQLCFPCNCFGGSYRYSAGLMWPASVVHSVDPQPGIAAAGATGTACRDGGLHQALRDWCLNLAAA